jgi:cytochrome c oxidase cbb3-type subunit III
MDERQPDRRDEPDRVVHEYDGIQEYDNKLPLWWQYTLYGAMAFALVYWFHYEVLKSGKSQKQEFEQEMAAVRAAQAEKAKASGLLRKPETLITMSKDGATVAKGKEVFATTCAACHRADGGGVIGPNLTDEFWLHGNAPNNIFDCVHDGITAKGMPAWGPQLGQDKVAAVVAYVLTIQNTNAPGGKAPQGEKL